MRTIGLHVLLYVLLYRVEEYRTVPYQIIFFKNQHTEISNRVIIPENRLTPILPLQARFPPNSAYLYYLESPKIEMKIKPEK